MASLEDKIFGKPQRLVLAGHYVRLEPLAAQHGDDLFAASSVADASERFRWLFEAASDDRAVFDKWFGGALESVDPLFFAIVDEKSGKALGRQAIMRIDAKNGVGEIGNIYWGPDLSRTRGATEALYLTARYLFDDLGYRRFEWKCNNRNEPSKRAAQRFGFTFEGLFRQHLIVKGENRDTAWFSIIDSEWPALKQAYEAWLSPANFDAEGKQITRLEDLRKKFLQSE
ncbi:GNAT family N-acetyltransferase [Limoniibacter endophyticus]|uniref:Acetyltransferase GCN5 n=1 Tax=Limoniibacter endophyticus TaxID=1565040 RepID=A0A8J3DPP3_9HYPH|nr:GNAT family protein [Limoniibacter endophyticus]GHC64371.1 acetyltransferase GCN5 [Limoniibacter endophyticus]